MKNYILIVIIFFLFLWGIILRAPEVLGGNFLFGHDHGRDYLAAYNIVENHKLTLIGAEAGSGVAGINGVFHGPGYFYLISLAYILFQGNPYGAQFFMFLFGIATMVVGFFTVKKMFGKIPALFTLFFISVSPLIVSQSRFIWSSHPVTVFIILALYFAYMIPKNPSLYAPLAVFTAGFTYNFQLGVAVPLTAGILVSIPLIYRVKDKKTYIFVLLALLFAFLPMILFELRHGFMATNSLIHYALGGGAGSGGSIFESLRLQKHFLFYWYNFINTFTFEFSYIPSYIQKAVVLFSIPSVIYGLVLEKNQARKQFIALLLGICVFTWGGYLLLNNVVWDYYLTHTRIAFILLFSISLGTLLKGKSIIMKICAMFIFFVVPIGLLGSVRQMYSAYTHDVMEKGVVEKYQGIKSIIDFVYIDAKGKPFSVFVFMPSVYTHPFDYLFKTYGKKTYGYIPGNTKEGLSYLIIIPDTSQPWRHKGWLETVVQGGNTIWKKTMLNGVIVEKRMY